MQNGRCEGGMARQWESTWIETKRLIYYSYVSLRRMAGAVPIVQLIGSLSCARKLGGLQRCYFGISTNFVALTGNLPIGTEPLFLDVPRKST